MDGSMFKGLGEGIAILFIICCISVPLGIWKLFDIVMWIVDHLRVHVI